MMKNNKILAIVILIIVLGLGLYFVRTNQFGSSTPGQVNPQVKNDLKTPDLSESNWNKLLSSDHQKGGPDAQVTMVEFSDFECPACAAAQVSLRQILVEYNDQIRLIYHHFPLEFHPLARPASLASYCAEEQGKFWEYHDLVFDNQRELSKESLMKWAKALSLNESQFNTCYTSKKYNSKLEQDVALGKAMRISGTPTFYINGKLVEWESRNEGWYQALKRYIEATKQ